MNSLPPISSFLPDAYYGAEKEMDTVLAPTRIDANGNVDTRSVLERSQAAGVDDAGKPYEGRVGESTYNMMASSRITMIALKASESVSGIEDRYNRVMSKIASERPELAEKDWDFTINADDEIEIIAGSDKLRDSEIKYLEGKLENFSEGFADYANAMTTVYQQYSERPYDVPDYGKYNVTRENFGEFFRGREFMSKVETSEHSPNNNHFNAFITQLAEKGAGLRIDLPQESTVKVDVNA